MNTFEESPSKVVHVVEGGISTVHGSAQAHHGTCINSCVLLSTGEHVSEPGTINYTLRFVHVKAFISPISGTGSFTPYNL